MKKIFKENKILILILSASLLLGAFYINWGLPELWHVDEWIKVDLVLNMASNVSLNPKNFINPSFHLYLLLIVLLPYFVFVKFAPGAVLNISTVYIISRFLSVIMFVSTVFVVYLIGRKIRGVKTGNFSALILAVSMGFVNIAHFATPDTSAAFLGALTLLFCVYILDTGLLKYYILAGASAGLAVSAKYTAWLLVLPIAAAFFMREGRKVFQENAGRINAKIVSKIMLVTGVSLAFFSFFVGEAVVIKLFSADGIVEPGTKLFMASIRNTGLSLGLLIIISGLIGTVFKPAGNLFANICTNGKVRLAALSMIALFFVGTPFALLDPKCFLDGLRVLWEFARGSKDFSNSAPSWGLYAGSLINFFGMPLFLLCITGLAYGFYKACRGDKYCVIFLFWIMPFFSLVSVTHLFAMRYLVPVVAVLALFAGMAISGLLSSRKLPKLAALVLISSIFIYSLAYTAAMEWMFVNDSRYKSAEWIAKNIPAGSVIDTYSTVMGTLPAIPAGYNVRHIPQIEDREIGRSEFEEFLKSYRGDMGEYIILTGASFDRYLIRPDVYPAQSRFYKELIEGRAGYELAEKFDFRGLLNPAPESVDPVILIFRKGQKIED